MSPLPRSPRTTEWPAPGAGLGARQDSRGGALILSVPSVLWSHSLIALRRKERNTQARHPACPQSRLTRHARTGSGLPGNPGPTPGEAEEHPRARRRCRCSRRARHHRAPEAITAGGSSGCHRRPGARHPPQPAPDKDAPVPGPHPKPRHSTAPQRNEMLKIGAQARAWRRHGIGSPRRAHPRVHAPATPAYRRPR